MSIGINLVQQLLEQASRHLYPNFDVEIVERHHNQKKDAPSGTALMLADSINASVDDDLDYVYGRQGNDTKRKARELGIHAVRGGTIVGDHEVIFAGTDEIISIRHQAFSRQVFGNGAVAASRFIAGREAGFYSMRDMLA
jgi:4-hydroxy-tetrahydrodipicolinate reductase